MVRAGGQPLAAKARRELSMSRIFALLAGALCLSACSYLGLPSIDTPSFGSGSAAGTTHVRVESEPSGAEVRYSGAGPACRTPCTLAIPDSGLSSVTFSLTGYVPQSVPVRVTRLQQSHSLNEGGVDEPTISIDPNPVFAELELAPPPPPPKKKAPPKRKPQAASASTQTQPAPQQPAQQQPPQQQGFGPPPQQQQGFGPPPPQQPGFGPPPQQQPPVFR